MSFVKVSAVHCNSQGIVGSPSSGRIEFYLSIDLIGGIRSQEVMIKGAELLKLDGNYYKEVRLAKDVNVEEL